MKKFFLFALVAMLFAACTTNDMHDIQPIDVPETLTVGFEEDTRIQLNEANKTVWTKDDLVSVFYRSDANQKWQYTGETGERAGTIKRASAPEYTHTISKIVVAYPYNESYYLNPETCNLQAYLPATQNYLADSYGLNGNIMVSSSEYKQFTLKSVCGWLKLQLMGNGERVHNITLKGNNGEQVAGEIYIHTADATSILAAEQGGFGDDTEVGGTMVEDNTILTEVVLNCGNGIELGAEATAFYIALPPQTFEKGITVEIADTSGYTMTKSTDKSLTIERNTIQPMAAFAVELVMPELINNKIWYTNGSTTEATVPNKTDVFGANIVSNIYDAENEYWIITFDGDVTRIGENAFHSSNLTSVTIPDSVTEIGENAFANCSSLTAFYGKFASEDNSCLIVDGVLNSFAIGCGATSYTIPDSVTSIGDYAFSDCESLTSVTIPNSVTSIGDYAFSYCNSLKEVYCKPTTPPAGGSNMFSSNASGRRIFVPASDDDSIINAYKAAQYWSGYESCIYELYTGEPVQADINFNAVTANWTYYKDAAIDAANSGEYTRDFEMTVANHTLPTGVTAAQILANIPKAIKVTINGVEVAVNAKFVLDSENNVHLEFSNFAWDKTYEVEAKYMIADQSDQIVAEATVKAIVNTVDRNREPIVINLGSYTANFKANIQLINNEINDSLDAVYETLVLGNEKHYDISRDAWLEANFIANYTCTNTIVADGVKVAVADQSNSVIKIGNNGKNAFTTFSYADFNFVPAKVEYTKTITTWYGQAVVLNKVINFKFPVYNLKHNTMYVSGSNNSFYTQAQPKYTWMNNNKDEGLLKFDVVVDLRTAFDIVDTGGSMLTADQLVALGLSSEFEIKGTHHEGIEIDQSSGQLLYRGNDSYVNIRGKIVITHNNGAKYAIMPASFNTGGTYESYNVVKFNPVNTATVTKNPTISVNSATAYNVHVLDYISLTDYRNSGPGFSLINNGAWVVGNGTNGFAQGVDVCANDMYRITDTWTMDLSKVDASVRPYISLDNDNGILTFDNTQCGYKGVFSIPVTLTIENCWMAKPQQLTVKVTFYSL